MKNYSRFYNELNGHQKAAVDTTDGPILVLAGPGTGKTQLLSVRAGSIIEKGKAGCENILILTYTNPAAKAMKKRLADVIGAEGYEVEVGTFHSFANSIIQESEEAANYVGDKVQLDEVEQARVIEYILDNTKGIEEIRPFRAPYTYLKEIIKRIGELKKDAITPLDLEKYLSKSNNEYKYMDDKYQKRMRALAAVYKRYEELKEGGDKSIFDERGRYDFDDMILFATRALKEEKALKEEYRKQYTYVMVDEFQDTNGAQMELLFTMMDKKNPNLCCVGDDDQSIYRFQGASVGNFKLLEKRFPDIRKISLKDNYRSSKELIDISETIINLIPAKERMARKELAAVKDYSDKEIMFREFTTEEEELIYIVDKVKELKSRIECDKNLTKDERKYPYNNIAVLVRKRKDILKVIDTFLRAGIPYATDGKEDMSGEKRVRQLLDVLELAYIDPAEYESKDLVLYKVLTSDYFRIPQPDILRFISYVNGLRQSEKASRRVTLLGEFLEYFSHQAKGGIKFAKPERIRSAARIIGDLLKDSGTRSVHTILLNFVKDAGIFAFILKEYADNNILRIRELRALASFVNMVKTADVSNPGIRLDDFMLEMNTRKEHGIPIQGSLVTLSQAGVRVYTAHGSKGLEFHSVIIPFCLHKKNWPASPIPELIRIPSDIFKAKESAKDKEAQKQLTLQDETRLFYVAMTRAKSNLIFTASPTESSISSPYIKGLDIQTESPDEPEEEEGLIAKSLDTTDLKDPFIGTEEVLKDMVENMSLNPTRLNTYITCARKFLYNDILKLPGPKKKSLVFGNCVHKALEDTYRQYMSAKTFPAFSFFEQAFKRALKFQGPDKIMEQDCLNKIITLKDWFGITSKSPIMPIGLEDKIIITVGDDIIFTGKYDKLEMEDGKKGLVRIIDYKTGKPDDHLKKIDATDELANPDCDGYLRQLVCYKLLFEKDRKRSHGMRVGCGTLVFIESVNADLKKQGYKKGDFATKSIEISDGMVVEIEELIKRVWADIKSLKFDKLKESDDERCRVCDFNSICWGGEYD